MADQVTACMARRGSTCRASRCGTPCGRSRRDAAFAERRRLGREIASSAAPAISNDISTMTIFLLAALLVSVPPDRSLHAAEPPAGVPTARLDKLTRGINL